MSDLSPSLRSLRFLSREGRHDGDKSGRVDLTKSGKVHLPTTDKWRGRGEGDEGV